MIDSKIEKLLITYKQKDEQAKKRAGNIDAEKALGKKNLLDKFGFSDDEESTIEAQWRWVRYYSLTHSDTLKLDLFVNAD